VLEQSVIKGASLACGQPTSHSTPSLPVFQTKPRLVGTLIKLDHSTQSD